MAFPQKMILMRFVFQNYTYYVLKMSSFHGQVLITVLYLQLVILLYRSFKHHKTQKYEVVTSQRKLAGGKQIKQRGRGALTRSEQGYSKNEPGKWKCNKDSGKRQVKPKFKYFHSTTNKIRGCPEILQQKYAIDHTRCIIIF